jgi:hypothetical protein
VHTVSSVFGSPCALAVPNSQSRINDLSPWSTESVGLSLLNHYDEYCPSSWVYLNYSEPKSASIINWKRSSQLGPLDRASLDHRKTEVLMCTTESSVDVIARSREYRQFINKGLRWTFCSVQERTSIKTRPFIVYRWYNYTHFKWLCFLNEDLSLNYLKSDIMRNSISLVMHNF